MNRGHVAALMICYRLWCVARGLVVPLLILVGSCGRFSALVGCAPSVDFWGVLYVGVYEFLRPLRSPPAGS